MMVTCEAVDRRTQEGEWIQGSHDLEVPVERWESQKSCRGEQMGLSPLQSNPKLCSCPGEWLTFYEFIFEMGSHVALVDLVLSLQISLALSSQRSPCLSPRC